MYLAVRIAGNGEQTACLNHLLVKVLCFIENKTKSKNLWRTGEAAAEAFETAANRASGAIKVVLEP